MHTGEFKEIPPGESEGERMKADELIELLRDENNCDVLDYIDDAAELLEQQQKEIEQLKARQKDIKSAKWLTWEEKFPDAKPPRENGLGVFCTACGLHSDNMYSFCPNCGSKMKEEK